MSCHVSNYFIVTSVVPQGSHIIYKLLILYFDSSVNVLLFADDAESPTNISILQSNLDKFVTWKHQNYFPLNINKCNVIPFSHLENVITYDYKIDYHLLFCYLCNFYKKI